MTNFRVDVPELAPLVQHNKLWAQSIKTFFDEEKDEPHGRRVNSEARIL